jgi:small-conductance mechanosensitive channel
VEGITIRETRLTTFDGQLVVIPNRDVYKNVIRVQTHYDLRRSSFAIGVAYENDARQATRVVAAALATVDGVAADPAPLAIVVELGVSTVNIEARYWTVPQQLDALLIQDEAITAVKVALEAEGIEMPAEIVALQATSSFRAALQGDAEVTPGGGVVSPDVRRRPE